MPYADQQVMYDHIDVLSQYNAELKLLRGADRVAFRNKYSGQFSMSEIIRRSQIQLKNGRGLLRFNPDSLLSGCQGADD
ncbi:TPA: hypothetical protein ACJG4C_003134 [Salmonella enterica subsp. diarizonae serovar 61:r:z53]